MSALGWDAWFTVAVAAAMVVALMRDLARPDVVMLCGLGVLLGAGVVTPEQAFKGFANAAVLTVASLYVVAAGVERTNALARLDGLLFASAERERSLGRSLARFMLPTSFLSGLLNNTPIVAMLTPRLQQWAQRRGIPASKLMIPLSYSAITGGLLTLFGTSTTLIVAGLMQAEGHAPLGLFDVTWVGLPLSLAVALYFALIGHRFLPDRGTLKTAVEDELQDDLFEVKVTVQSPLTGQNVADAGLRDLGDAYLVHVHRAGQIMQVTPRTVLEQGDVLAFTGGTTGFVRLLHRPGLKHHRRPVGLGDEPMETLPLYEAVVADSSDLVGRSLRDVGFRERYGGVVLGVQRKNEPVTGKLAQIPLRAGDLLIVEAERNFLERWGAGREEFYLVAARERQGVPEAQAAAEIEEQQEETEEEVPAWQAPFALTLLGAMVLAAATGLVPILTSSFVVALLMVVTGCISPAEAQRALNIQVLLVIAAALGVGGAIETTGLARVLGAGLVEGTAGIGPVAALAAVYVATNLLTELVTNNAAAVLMLPIATAAASSLNAPPVAFGIVVAVAASASFLTPIGYQTNLMVMAPGGYRFSDYLRAGWPVTLLALAIAVTVVALRWL